MGKKKQQKPQSQPQDDAEISDVSDEQVKPKAKPKNKKVAKTPTKSAPKKQTKPAESKSKPKKNGKAVNQADGDDQQIIDKKKDFLPGQKHQTPDEDDGARAFYQSLYQQNPQSQIAKKYCLQYGLLEKDEAVRIQKQFAKKK